ncbi:MAG: hypothetical protein KKD44_07320 [Proteobacteria bacterium]|nr:hypothetical protein [Pseudomonadota bacterium]
MMLFGFPYSAFRHTQTIDYSDYRSFPFQWVYPEHFYKADVLPVQHDSGPHKGFVTIHFFGLSAKVPSEYERTGKNADESTIIFKSNRSKGSIFCLSLNNESAILGTDFDRKRNQDYYSSFSSAEEFYTKTFTLTPDIIDENTFTGDLWMIHSKAKFFEKTDSIKIYINDQFKVFVSKYKPDNPYLDNEIVIFHKNLPEHTYLTAGFKNIDFTVRQFIETLAPDT